VHVEDKFKLEILYLSWINFIICAFSSTVNLAVEETLYSVSPILVTPLPVGATNENSVSDNALMAIIKILFIIINLVLSVSR
jgi:hypothetical protein